MRIKITILLGSLAIAAALLVVLLQSPLTVAATNGAQVTGDLAVVDHAGSYCQPGEVLPRGTTAIRLSLGATTGPRIIVSALAGSRTVADGTVGSGWYGNAVTVAVRPPRHQYSDITICARFSSLTGEVGVEGERSGSRVDGARVIPGRMRIAYLRPIRRSWLSLAPTVFERLEIGRAASGSWVLVAIVALIASAIVLAWLALTRELM